MQKAQFLIYDGVLVLAMFDVARTQAQVIELVEREGGYVSTRTNWQMVLRVPAAKFRALLDEISGLGDLLDLRWQAQDVTAAVRDVQIRLQSALAMRERLELLLERADKVEDALAIEEQLRRVILEIEQLKAALRGYQERIAYSTITVEFRPKRAAEIKDEDFSLPFRWLNELGVQRLLDIPEVR